MEDICYLTLVYDQVDSPCFPFYRLYSPNDTSNLQAMQFLIQLIHKYILLFQTSPPSPGTQGVPLTLYSHLDVTEKS